MGKDVVPQLIADKFYVSPIPGIALVVDVHAGNCICKARQPVDIICIYRGSNLLDYTIRIVGQVCKNHVCLIDCLVQRLNDGKNCGRIFIQTIPVSSQLSQPLISAIA